MSDIPGWGMELRSEVRNLSQAFAGHVKDNRESHKALYERTERPSWAVTVVISILSSMVVGLAVFTATHI